MNDSFEFRFVDFRLGSNLKVPKLEQNTQFDSATSRLLITCMAFAQTSKAGGLLSEVAL